MRSSLVDALNVERDGRQSEVSLRTRLSLPKLSYATLHLCFISFAFIGICALGPPTGQVSRSDRLGSVVLN